MNTKDILLFENGDGGQLYLSKDDIQLTEVLYNQFYLALFGGNYESVTTGNEIEGELRNKFNVLNHIVWEKFNDKGFDGWKQKTSKESLRKFYPNSERLIFGEKQSFGKILKEERLKAGYTTISLAEIIGAFGKTNHGGSVSNWENDLNIPTEEQYKKLQLLLKLPNRDDVIRTFNCKSDIQYTDVLHYKTVRPYKGKHPFQ